MLGLQKHFTTDRTRSESSVIENNDRRIVTGCCVDGRDGLSRRYDGSCHECVRRCEKRPIREAQVRPHVTQVKPPVVGLTHALRCALFSCSLLTRSDSNCSTEVDGLRPMLNVQSMSMHDRTKSVETELKWKSKFPKLTQSIFGLSKFWSEFRPSLAIICRNALRNSLSPKMD